MKGNLYVITNKINGKEYIGKTYKTIHNRFKEHIRDSKKIEESGRPLYRAFKKYGIENFEISLIGVYPRDILEVKEIEEINRRETYHFGYNATLGGDGKRRFTIDPDEVYRIYKKNGNLNKAAEEIGCTYKTIVLMLKDYDLNNHYLMKNQDGQFLPKTVQLKNGPVKITFDSINKASYFVESLLKKDMNRRSIGSSISRAVCGERKGYLKMQWSHLEEAS